jgi:small-conductance mechanosensitive channel
MVPASNEPATSVEIPENLTQEQVRDLVARLSDEEVRRLIIDQFDKRASTQEPGADAAYVGQLRQGIKVAAEALRRMFKADHHLDDLPATFWRQLTDNGRTSGWTLLAHLIGLLLAGWAAEGLTRRMLDKANVKHGVKLPLDKRFNLACYGMLSGLAQTGAYAGGAVLFISLATVDAPTAQFFWYELLICLLMLKLVWLAVEQLVSPRQADTRLVSVSNAAAGQILAWSMLLSGALFLPSPPIAVLVEFGIDPDAVLLLRFIFGALFIGLLLALMIRLRNYGASLILNEDGDNGPIRQGLARSWWALASVYVLLIWFMSIGKRAATGESSMLPGLSSLFLFALIPYLDRGLKWLIAWYFSDKEETSDAREENGDEHAAAGITDTPDSEITAASEASCEEHTATGTIDVAGNEIAAADAVPAADKRAPAYIAIALRYTRVLMVLCIIAIFFRLWDIEVRALSAQLVGPRFASALFDISITILLTWALWGIIRISIERKLDDEKPLEKEQGETEAGGLGGSRVETVLPLIRIFIKITLIVMAVLISLSALGVNIGPLIAGAGVVGIAIGFGAQSLVRDIVSGFFYLIDDAFRIGEYVVIGEIRGTVEKISIRSFQLRHHNGPVNTVPYGEIRSLTNWSRDWAIMKFELRVSFETDIDEVRKIIKKIGLDIAADPAFAPLILAPLKSQGVNRMDDSALIIRCKFTAVPGQQYLVRREAFTRIQRVFEEKGIHFAPRRVLVESSTPEEAVKAAAGVLDQEPAAVDKSKPPPM